MVIRDLTLRSAASFGSFHLIRLLYDEYMYYLVEQRVARARGTCPIAVMGEVRAEGAWTSPGSVWGGLDLIWISLGGLRPHLDQSGGGSGLTCVTLGSASVSHHCCGRGEAFRGVWGECFWGPGGDVFGVQEGIFGVLIPSPPQTPPN